MEALYYLGVAFAVAGIVWLIMNQQMNKKIMESQLELTILQAGIESREESHANSIQEFEGKMRDTFSLLAKNAFDEVLAKADEEKSTSFNQATESLSKAMENYSKNINEIEMKSLERGTRLEERIMQVSELGIKLSEETTNLTRALKADSQAQGAWGELVLENLLQSLGFVKDKDYQTQTSF
ncbi:MAG: DNA recombination protein RmuC, partial [Candidatus Poseidoniaceae archaeon]|nr:DNA recombination protein RmuC [Candidatus Poseidoniaceae archaeon]